MSKLAAELALVALSIICGAGSFNLWEQGRRWVSVTLFVSGVTLMSVIVACWNISVG
jgi:hypothetical protein